MMKGPVWFQKISIPPPWKIIGNSEGEEGGSKVVISEGWGGGSMGKHFPKGDRPRTKH